MLSCGRPGLGSLSLWRPRVHANHALRSQIAGMAFPSYLVGFSVCIRQRIQPDRRLRTSGHAPRAVWILSAWPVPRRLARYSPLTVVLGSLASPLAPSMHLRVPAPLAAAVPVRSWCSNCPYREQAKCARRLRGSAATPRGCTCVARGCERWALQGSRSR